MKTDGPLTQHHLVILLQQLQLLMHACQSLNERSNSEHALVYSFVPVDQLPGDCPHKMDAFFSHYCRNWKIYALMVRRYLSAQKSLDTLLRMTLPVYV